MRFEKLLLVTGIVSILLWSCSDDVPAPVLDIDSFAGIDLRNPQAGDEAIYLRYESRCDRGFAFTGDTLRITVIERNDSLFLKEYMLLEGDMIHSAEHVIIPRDGYVLIPQRWGSAMLFFYGNDTIFLDRAPNTTLVQQGCRLYEEGEPFIGESIGTVEEFQFGEYRLEEKKGISCIPSFFEIDAYIFYDDYLNVVHTISDTDDGTLISGFVAIREGLLPVD